MIESTTTTPSDFYGGSRILLEGIIDEFLSCIGMIRRYQKSQTGWDPISSSTSRVKSPESMRELKYKHDIANPELMQQELKHCSDQIASTDLSLSTLKELILTPNADPDANSNTSAGAEKPVASDCRGIPLG